MIVINQEGFKELSKHSGNPFLDAMTDLQGFFQTIGAYQQNKEFIDKYSDHSLSDLKDKVKNILPDALNEKGEINFSKLEELAGQGNELASSILNIKKHREAFANAPLVDKINALKNPELADTLSANILDKQVVIKKKKQLIEDAIKKSNIPDKYKPLFLAFSEKIAKDPQTLSVMIPLLASSLGSLDNDTDNSK